MLVSVIPNFKTNSIETISASSDLQSFYFLIENIETFSSKVLLTKVQDHYSQRIPMEISMTYHASEEEIQNPMESIIARAQSGDKEAFGLIFEQHYRFIYKFIYAMLGEHSLAEELTQETFLGAYRTISSLRNEATLKTWLCAIAKNVIHTSFRLKRKEGRKSTDELETLQLSDENNSSPDLQFLNKELNRTIQAALEKLSEDKRIIFFLKEMQNLSYKEISDITGKSIPKLKTDLFRAKIEMRMLLRPYLEAENEL